MERLKEQNKADILLQLSEAVSKSDKDKGKIHQVFEGSFDCKEITSQYFFNQKLSYIPARLVVQAGIITFKR